jgi:hypothetical protein
MLRFTLHRPSQNSAVCACCQAMSCCDVSGRVHIGVRVVPAGHAHEGRLALATVRCDVLAGVTGLRRVRSFDFLDPAGRFLLQPGHEQTPTGFEDAPAQPGLGCDVSAWFRHGSPRGAGHGFEVEVLDSDHVGPAGEVGAGFLGPVFAPVSVFGFQPCDQGLHLVVAADPRAARASLRPSRRSRFASLRLSPAGLVISPVHSATATVTPRSRPTPPPAPGAGIGSGTTADAICQWPARSPAMGYDFHPASPRLCLNQTQPILGHQHTGPCTVVAADRPTPQARRSANPHARRPDTTSDADGSRRRRSATPGQGPATPAAEPSTTRRQATAPQFGQQRTVRLGR